ARPPEADEKALPSPIGMIRGIAADAVAPSSNGASHPRSPQIITVTTTLAASSRRANPTDALTTRDLPWVLIRTILGRATIRSPPTSVVTGPKIACAPR